MSEPLEMNRPPPSGAAGVEWLNPITGKVLKSEVVTANDIPVELASPKFGPDIALRIKRIEEKWTPPNGRPFGPGHRRQTSDPIHSYFFFSRGIPERRSRAARCCGVSTLSRSDWDKSLVSNPSATRARLS